MPAPIAVVGSDQDAHVAAVCTALADRGCDTVVLDGQAFPENMSIALGEAAEAIDLEGTRMPRPSAVYVRGLYQSPGAFGVDADEAMQENWRRTLLVFRERNTVLSSILLRWELSGVPLYNPIGSATNVTKPYQLALLSSHGLPVPATLWTNDGEAVRRFCRGRDVVYKPVAGGAATRRLEPSDLTEDRLARLAASPVCFQELLPGDDIRVYVVDGVLVAAMRIDSDEVDFRGHEKNIEAFTVAPAVEAMCIQAASVLGLRFTGMDLKADARGDLKILELNPSPMFLGFEAATGVDVLGPLCDALQRHGDIPPDNG